MKLGVVQVPGAVRRQCYLLHHRAGPRAIHFQINSHYLHFPDGLVLLDSRLKMTPISERTNYTDFQLQSFTEVFHKNTMKMILTS